MQKDILSQLTGYSRLHHTAGLHVCGQWSHVEQLTGYSRLHHTAGLYVCGQWLHVEQLRCIDK